MVSEETTPTQAAGGVRTGMTRPIRSGETAQSKPARRPLRSGPVRREGLRRTRVTVFYDGCSAHRSLDCSRFAEARRGADRGTYIMFDKGISRTIASKCKTCWGAK